MNGKPEYVIVNKTALCSAMKGFIAGTSVHADDHTQNMIKLFEDMVLSYLKDEYDKEGKHE